VKTTLVFACALFLAVAPLAVGQDVQTATLVGTVTDSTGSVVPAAAVTITNTATQVVTHVTTNAEGSYYAPFLANGTYDMSVEASGFKKYVRNGVFLAAGQTPRIDVQLEVGATTETVEVTAASPLLDTDTAVVGGVDDTKIIHETPMIQAKPQHLMYYMEGSNVYNDYHMVGLPAAQINFTIDGSIVKQTPRSSIGEVNNSVTPPVDSITEAQVWTTGIPAELGHSAGGAYNMVTKSGTNQVHWSAEERYIGHDFIHRQQFNQGPLDTAFEYHNFDTVLGGPIYIPKVYDGRNKTFFFLAFRWDYDHETNFSTVNAVTPQMLQGDLSFGGLGFPIYDPKSIICTNPSGCAGAGTGWTATPFPNMQIPLSRFDPVTAKFLSLNPYASPNTAGFYTTTGPSNNLLGYTHYLADKDGYVARFDHQLTATHKIYFRWAWNRYRTSQGRESTQDAWLEIDGATTGNWRPEPIDTDNLTFGDVYNISPTIINEFRVAYQRRTDTVTSLLNNQNWAGILGIPGVGPQTFPGFVSTSGSSVSWSANPGNYTRTSQDNFEYADNVTKVYGLHTFKMGYQGLRMRENDVTLSQPSGVYNFSANGSALPFTPNTGNSWASFLLGAVDSANFTTLLSDYLPRWWSHQAFVQDDWRASHDLTVSLGLRWSYESPGNTKYGLQSQFNPNVIDPLTGLMGAITHPKGSFYNASWNNFTPRVGLSWNFRPKFVFRGSFGMFTVDNMPELGQDEYTAQAVVQQLPGNPSPAFYLSQGPGPINYSINSTTGTANFVGQNYSSRNATYIDPHIYNPYTMSWSGGVQWEFHPNTIAEAVYQGSAGVGLVPPYTAYGASCTGVCPVNINVLPQSIYNSTNTTLLNAVYANTQNYLAYPQFGTINYYSNFGHSTYHGLTTRVERRFSNGLSYNFLFTWSKNLGGSAGTGWQYYDWNLTKGPLSNDAEYGFVSQASYQLPVGKDRHFMNRGGILNTILGDWTFLTIQSLRSGLPVNFTMSGSPYKYLPGETQPNIVSGQGIVVQNYSVGNLWPESTQNPYFNINAFAYPAAFTGGNAGVGIARAGGVWWPQYSLTKTVAVREKFRITVRMDANNLLPETRALLSPNTTVNITSPQTFGRFANAGSSFSNWYTPNGNFVGVLRLEF
jgi:Carboxypeptidase regulatory-like domain